MPISMIAVQFGGLDVDLDELCVWVPLRRFTVAQ